MTTAPHDHPPAIDIAWCRDPAWAPAIADFFVAHAGPSYISHSELQFGRAIAPDRWSDDLRAMIADDAARAIAAGLGAEAGTRCALASVGGAIGGFAFVRLVSGTPAPFAVLEDLLIGPEHRGAGLGGRFLDWITEECRAAGCVRLFLESGRNNHGAHRFFERSGFEQTSVVMMRALAPREWHVET